MRCPGRCSPRSARSSPTMAARARPACAPASTATAAALARCSSTCATARPRPGTATASTATATAREMSTTPRTRSRRPRTTCARCCAPPMATSPGGPRLQPLAGLRRTTCSRAPAPTRARRPRLGPHRRAASVPGADIGPAAGPANLRARPARRLAARVSALPAGRWPRVAPRRSSTPACYDDVDLDPAPLPPARHRRARGRPPHARRRHRSRPRARRRRHTGGLGRVRRPARPRPRLDAGVRALGHAARPARSCPRSSSSATTATRATARRAPAGRMPGPPTRLLGVAVLRHGPPVPALRVGHDVRDCTSAQGAHGCGRRETLT